MSEVATGNTGGTGQASQGVGTNTGTAAPVGGSPNSGTGAGGAQASNAEWYGSFSNADAKGYVQNKGFKSPEALAESYMNLEKLMTVPAERIIKLPEKLDAENMGPVWDKLGRPQKPEEYQLVTPKEGGDDRFTSAAAAAFHKSGLSRIQANELTKWWNDFATERVKSIQTERETQFNQEQQKLKGEWGAAHDQNVMVGRKAAEKFGISAEQISGIEKVLGFAGTMKLFHNIGSKLGEHSFVDGNSGSQFGGALTPDQAQHKYNNLRKDADWVRRYTAGGAAEREELEKLMRYMNPEVA